MNSRQKKILEKLNNLGSISIKEEVERFSVSSMTIRRDIRFLEKHGLAKITFGGAIARISCVEQFLIHNLASDEQKRIAKKTLELIPNGGIVMLSTGSTTLEVARQLGASGRRLSVITNSLPIAANLFQTNIQVILTGGTLRSNSLDTVGPVAEKNIDEYYPDILITGCDGASSTKGFFTKDINLAEMEKKSVHKSKKVFLVTESFKFEKTAFVKFADLGDITTLITDKKLPEEYAKVMEIKGIEVILV